MSVLHVRLAGGLIAAAILGGALALAEPAAAAPRTPTKRLSQPATTQTAPIRTAAAKNAGAAKQSGDNSAGGRDPFQVPPNGSVKELIAFIKGIRTFRASSPAQFQQFRNKAPAALKAAGEQIQKIATPEDRQLDGFDEAMSIVLVARVNDADELSADELKSLTAEVKTLAAQTQSPAAQFQISQAALQLATGLEFGGKPDQALELYKAVGPAFAESDDPQVASNGRKMQGAARRLDLIGNPIEITGTLLDGAKFDWSKYRGKVVLIDFWATWCGPCIAELPNVRKNYELYHDRGFEVVGISLDQDRDKLEEFLHREKNPWVTLNDGGWNDNAVAAHYGVFGIPTVILVDKEGKVVSTRARGPELGRLLNELLGPAVPQSDDNQDDDKSAAKDKSAK